MQKAARTLVLGLAVVLSGFGEIPWASAENYLDSMRYAEQVADLGLKETDVGKKNL